MSVEESTEIPEETPSAHARRLWWLIPVAALIAVLIAGAVFVNHRRQAYQAYMVHIRPGVTIAGLDVGGMTPDEARDLLRKEWESPLARPIELRYLDSSHVLSLPKGQELDPSAVGLTVLAEAMVDEAAAIGADIRFSDFLFQTPPPFDVNAPLQTQFDQALLADFVDDLAASTDRPAQEHRLSAEELAFYPGQAGSELDRHEAAEMIATALSDREEHIVTLPVALVEITPLDEADLRSELEVIAADVDRPAREHRFSAEELAFYPGQAGLELDSDEAVAMITAALSNGETRPIKLPVTVLEVTPLDEADLRSELEEIAAGIDRPVQEHRLSAEDLAFYPGQTGVELDRDEAVARITAALANGETQSVEFPVTALEVTPLDEADLRSELEEIATRMTPTALYAMGCKVATSVGETGGIEDFQDFVRRIDVIYYNYHRGGEIGHAQAAWESDRSVRVVMDTPYPCEFERGILYGFARRFLGNASDRLYAEHVEGAPCRRQGARSCTYRLNW